MKSLLLGAVALVSLGGCVADGGARYGRASDSNAYGYSDVRLDENRYRVQYRSDGENYLSEDFAMRRAAELTRQRGYDWFQVLNRSRAVSDDMFGRYDQYRYRSNDTRSDADDRRDRPGYGSGYDNDAVVVLDIVMGNNPPPNGGSVYDADRVFNYRSADGYGRRGAS